MCAAVLYARAQEWRNADFGNYGVAEGSALDLSANISTGVPAGSRGRLIVSKSGRPAFESAPEIPVRFMGARDSLSACTAPIKGLKPEIYERIYEDYAKQVRLHGYNLLCVDTSYIYDAVPEAKAARFEAFDGVMQHLKNNGVYLFISLNFYTAPGEDGYSVEDRDDIALRALFGDKPTRDNWKSWCEERLNHVSKRSNVAWKDDSAIACIDPYETIDRAVNRVFKQPTQTRMLVKTRWVEWLKEKYRSVHRLGKAWSLEINARDFETLPIIFEEAMPSLEVPASKKPLYDRDALILDWRAFTLSALSDFADFASKTMRDAGYKGMICVYSNVPRMNLAAIRAEKNDISTATSIFAVPSKSVYKDSKIDQGSPISDGGGYWRRLLTARFDNRPFFGVYAHCFWNKNQRESGLLVPAYSAFQDFSGLIIIERPLTNYSRMKFAEKEISPPSLLPYSVGNSPVVRANEFLSSCLFLRGDVSKSKHKVSLTFSRRDLDDYEFSAKPLNASQAGIALMTGLEMSMSEVSSPPMLSKVVPVKPFGSMCAFGSPKMRPTDWFVEELPKKVLDFNLQSMAVKLKRNEVLGKDNRSEPKKNIFETDTGEILMRADENFLRVATLRTEGVCIGADKTEVMKVLTVESSSVPATVALCVADGAPSLSDSSRMVLVYSTRAENSDTDLSKDSTTLLSPGAGRAPVRIKTGKLSALFNFGTGKNYALYALALDGQRRERVAMSENSGLWRVSLDTATLKSGATVFFELVRE